MSSGMFRGKESSNNRIISISSRLIEFWCFGLSGGGGGWMWVGGGWGVPPTHMHVHACMHTHTHAHVVNMIISCKWLPPLGESLGIPYDVICTCMCMCVHACACMHVHVGGMHPLTTPTPIHPAPPTPQRGDPRNHSKFNST